ncbi:MAG: chemotaxis protein CheW [Nitrospirae bacterium]|nr:chemotaxis protein CheW [Nitrospirota bacterium]
MNYNNYQELQILTFNIGGVNMAVDTTQIGRMLEIDEAVERNLKIERLDDRISFYDIAVIYSAPKVLMINDKMPFGVVIDKPDDIISVPIDSLRPLPALISDSKCPKAIWGVALMNDEVVLLIDFYKLQSAE